MNSCRTTIIYRSLLFGVATAIMTLHTVSAAPGVSPVAGPGGALENVKPAAIEDVGVDEHLEATLPLNLVFQDDAGHVVRLRDYFDGKRPVILSMNYSNCPRLCNVQLTGLTRDLAKLDWSAGKEFRIVSLSIDPTERPRKAAETKQKYVTMYGRGSDGWNFLVGDRRGIERLTAAVGFRYKYQPEYNEYSHPAVAVLCTPDGRISQYLYGVEFPEQTLRLSLAKAGEGEIGGIGEQILLFCFHYSAAEKKFVPRVAEMTMTVAGVLTVMLLGGGLLVLWSREQSGPAEVMQHLSTEQTAANAVTHTTPAMADDPPRWTVQ